VEDASAPSRDGPLEFGDPGVDEGGVVAAQVQPQVTVSLSATSKAPQT